MSMNQAKFSLQGVVRPYVRIATFSTMIDQELVNFLRTMQKTN